MEQLACHNYTCGGGCFLHCPRVIGANFSKVKGGLFGAVLPAGAAQDPPIWWAAVNMFKEIKTVLQFLANRGISDYSRSYCRRR